MLPVGAQVGDVYLLSIHDHAMFHLTLTFM